MIRNETERRNAKKRVADLRAELEKRPCNGQPEEARGVLAALHMQLSDVEAELDEYERLKQRPAPVLRAADLDQLGEMLIKARIACGWSQTDLAKELGMEPQQVQRYEKNDWQKISLWRLQEVVEVLDLDLDIRASLADEQAERRPGALWSGPVSSFSKKKIRYNNSVPTVSREDASDEQRTRMQGSARDSEVALSPASAS